MSNFDNALRELRARRSGMQVELEKLDQIISGIESLNGAGSDTYSATDSQSISSFTSQDGAGAESTMGELEEGIAASRSNENNRNSCQAHDVSLRSQEDQLGAESKMGKGERSRPETKAHYFAAGRQRIAAATRARWEKNQGRGRRRRRA